MAIRLAGLEAPTQIGRVERQGDMHKTMMTKVTKDALATGKETKEKKRSCDGIACTKYDVLDSAPKLLQDEFSRHWDKFMSVYGRDTKPEEECTGGSTRWS